MQQKSSSKSSISGFIAGCSIMTLFPLEKMKLHMIVSEKSSPNFIPYYPSTYSLIKSMQKQGIKYMYRGFHLQSTVSTAWAIYFYIYEFFKKLPSDKFKTEHYELYKFTVAAQAAMIGNFVSNPLFVLKTRAILLQNSENWFWDTYESLVKTWKVDGVRGFWRGYTVGLLLAFDGTTSMYMYETIKEQHFFSNLTWNSAFAGGTSKMMVCTLFFPAVLMKIRLQQEQFVGTIMKKSKDISEKGKGKMVYSGLIEGVKKIWRNEGIRGFYRGLPVTLIKVIPTQSLFFAVYDLTYRVLDSF